MKKYKMKSKLLSIAIIILLSVNTLAQNTLLLTNGKTKQIKDYKLDNKGFVSYYNTKNKLKTISNYYVFAIKDKDGVEHLVYRKDGDDEFTIFEMRSFVLGQTDAVNNFKSPLTTVGGIVSGAAAPFIHPTYAIIVSGIYTGGIGMTKPFKKKINVPAEYANNEIYILGYTKAANRKRVKNAIIGSLIGLAAGFTAYYVVKQ